MLRKSSLLLLLFFSFITAHNVFSQNSNFTILCIAAHPDDEDGATLAYYTRLKHYNAYTIFYTRGEGGQNETGPELYDELGKIREQECYNAAEIQGSKAYFLGFLDFGYSKTAKETFKFWGGEDSVLARIVYMIRVLRPDVVISNHDTITTKPKRQHGQHQAAGITIYDAFDKAADPNYHSEQLVNGVKPWQIKKLFFRQNDTSVTDVYEIDVSQKDASGKSIEEIYYDALAEHKTQGMDKEERNYRGVRRHQLVRSDRMYPVTGNDLFEGLVPEEKPKIDIQLKFNTYYYKKFPRGKSVDVSLIGEMWVKNKPKIGLVKTYDNTIERVLIEFMFEYDTLTPKIIESGDLSKYQTIVLDIRTYLYRPDVLKSNDRLLKYVKDGGNLVVFYNKPEDWNDKGNLAPYPIYLTTERVTEEDAAVTILETDNRLFTAPNKIYNHSWVGWIQERSIYLPSGDTLKTSPKYHRLLEMNDENDTVPSTSLLYAEYGKGTYIYCSLALYRQLKIFNEEAIKLFMNMISVKNTQY
jgi:LmbE family N-acetylglucosaminyl deacetylase